MAAASIMAVSALSSAYSQSKMYEIQGEQAKAVAAFQKSQAEINARFAEAEAEQTMKQGEKDIAEYQKKVNQIVGSQKATLAAQGIQIDSGTALELQQETAEIGALDVNTIRNNAWRQAFGFKQEAVASRFQGRLAELSGQSAASLAKFQSRSSLVTGGLQGLSYGMTSYDRYKSKNSKAKADSGKDT